MTSPARLHNASAPAFTPGPWSVVDHPTETCRIMGGIESATRVADVWCTDLPGGAENARLIASAPDLLAFARCVVDDSEVDVGDFDHADLLRFVREIQRQGREVIARARGQS